MKEDLIITLAVIGFIALFAVIAYGLGRLLVYFIDKNDKKKERERQINKLSRDLRELEYDFADFKGRIIVLEKSYANHSKEIRDLNWLYEKKLRGRD